MAEGGNEKIKEVKEISNPIVVFIIWWLILYGAVSTVQDIIGLFLKDSSLIVYKMAFVFIGACIVLYCYFED